MLREAQVSTAYKIYSETALKEGFWDISQIFSTIAGQENEHYEIFLSYVPQNVQETQFITHTPVIIAKGTTAQNIVSAINSEVIAIDDYPAYAAVALQEGFPDISAAFTDISNVERYHRSLYEELQYNLVNNEIFSRDRTVLWQCCACGFIVESNQAPSPCPVCGNVGSYKYLGDNVNLYMEFTEPNGDPITVIVENKDPAITIEDISTEMNKIITSGIEGPSLTSQNSVVAIQKSQRYNMKQ